MKKQSEVGLTLVEVLIGVVISLIAMSLIFSFIMNSFSQFEKTNSHNNLRNEANIITQYFITAHQNANSTDSFEYHIKTSENGGDVIVSIQDYSIDNSKYEFEIVFNYTDSDDGQLKIANINTTINLEQTFNINAKHPLYIEKLKLIDKNTNDEYELSIIINRI